jgi:hypothetical protein
MSESSLRPYWSSTTPKYRSHNLSALPHHSTSTKIISFPAISIDGGVHAPASTIVPPAPAAPPAPATPLALPAAPVAAAPPVPPTFAAAPPHAGSMVSSPIKRSGDNTAILSAQRPAVQQRTPRWRSSVPRPRGAAGTARGVAACADARAVACGVRLLQRLVRRRLL